MTSPAFSIGVDFGTASARTLALDLRSGEEVAVCELAYRHGVIDEILPESDERLPGDWALQDPDDYIDVLERGVAAVLAQHPGMAPHVVGIGVDATSCTVVPVDGAGGPLCRSPKWRRRAHAWPKLWKHHAAQPVATRLNEVGAERGEPFLARYGGRISSEWYFPKLIQVWLEDREVYDAMAGFVEATDWVVWYLCGQVERSSCPAAYKALWSAEGGLPGTDFFEAAFPGFSRPSEKLGERFMPLGSRAGYLRPELGRKLGLPEDVAVAVGNVDSFVSFPGAGAEGAGTFVSVVGTSICDMVVDHRQVPLTGITGVAKDGILPGMYGYEAGQAAVGDMFGWFAEKLGRSGPGQAAAEVLLNLEAAASGMNPRQTGLVALDWWNGNRSVLADADLSGALIGLTLQTTAAEIYRALMEAVAFGNKVIVDNFVAGGVDVREIVACGGIAERSSLLMQLFADVSGFRVTVPASSQVPARGSALFGAVAAGAGRSGFGDIAQAAKALRPGAARTYVPSSRDNDAYNQVYVVWKRLHDVLGHEHLELMHGLKHLKLESFARETRT